MGTVPCEFCGAPVEWPGDDPPPSNAVAVCRDVDACDERTRAKYPTPPGALGVTLLGRRGYGCKIVDGPDGKARIEIEVEQPVRLRADRGVLLSALKLKV